MAISRVLPICKHGPGVRTVHTNSSQSRATARTSNGCRLRKEQPHTTGPSAGGRRQVLGREPADKRPLRARPSGSGSGSLTRDRGRRACGRRTRAPPHPGVPARAQPSRTGAAHAPRRRQRHIPVGRREHRRSPKHPAKRCEQSGCEQRAAASRALPDGAASQAAGRAACRPRQAPTSAVRPFCARGRQALQRPLA